MLEERIASQSEVIRAIVTGYSPCCGAAHRAALKTASPETSSSSTCHRPRQRVDDWASTVASQGRCSQHGLCTHHASRRHHRRYAIGPAAPILLGRHHSWRRRGQVDRVQVIGGLGAFDVDAVRLKPVPRAPATENEELQRVVDRHHIGVRPPTVLAVERARILLHRCHLLHQQSDVRADLITAACIQCMSAIGCGVHYSCPVLSCSCPGGD